MQSTCIQSVGRPCGLARCQPSRTRPACHRFRLLKNWPLHLFVWTFGHALDSNASGERDVCTCGRLVVS